MIQDDPRPLRMPVQTLEMTIVTPGDDKGLWPNQALFQCVLLL